MTFENKTQEEEKIVWSNKKAFVLDLDGTVYLGENPIESSISFINNAPFDFYFLTNNTSKSKKSYEAKLRSMGVKSLSTKQIITPIDPLLLYLKNNNMQQVYVLGTNDFKEELIAEGLQILKEEEFSSAEALILAYDTTIDYQKISNACLLLAEGVPYLATHYDDVCPTETGFIPDVGSFIALFERSNKRAPEIVFGKPNQELLKPLLKRYTPSELVIVGDRIYTDMALAKNAEIDFFMVLSGETKEEELSSLDSPPIFVIQELGDLAHFTF